MTTHLITELLKKVRAGDWEARNELMERVYSELQRVARAQMRKERGGHTLRATALVNEAYFRLFGTEVIDYQDRRHFFAVAARQMRHVLVDHARSKRAVKRGAGGVRVSFDDFHAPVRRLDEDILDLDVALDELESKDQRAASVVEMKFFGGLTDEEVAKALDVSFASVRRDWEFGRAWLIRRLSRSRRSE